MMISFVIRSLSLFVCVSLTLSACDDAGGGDPNADASVESMDAGEEERDAAARADTSVPRDSGRDASDSNRDASASDGAVEDPYQCEPPAPPDGAIGLGQPCCSGLGTCVAASDGGSSGSAGDCNAAENLRCMAASSGADAGTTRLASCRMRPMNTPDGGTSYEGRCVPECLTRGTSTLERGECPAEFVCTPCYNLINGEATGVCDDDGDAPVEPAPPGFTECGESLGYCIPMTSIGPTGTNLQQLNCEADERCAPKQRVEEPDSCFARCDSVFGAGACLPAFLIPMESRGILQPASCATGELCSPCINPTTMMRTGACN